MDKYGFRISAIQVKPRHVFGAMEDVLNFCNQTGCKKVVISMLPFSCILGSEKKFYDFVKSLDRWHAHYGERGIALGYHHHNWEYITLSGGKTRMEVLLEETKDIQFVHDTYWTTKCGLSSPEQIRRFGHRLMGIHLRDLSLYKKGLQVLSKDAAVGDGVVDFPAVLQAAKEVGSPYLVIEQKTEQPYQQLQRSYAYCVRIGDGGVNYEK
jgi:sugar phosphate isomerase/epimerase